jgi:hypothetical protein
VPIHLLRDLIGGNIPLRNPETRKEWLRKWGKTRTKPKHQYTKLLGGAKFRDVKVDLTFEDFVEIRVGNCVYCNDHLPKFEEMHLVWNHRRNLALVAQSNRAAAL